MYTLCERFVFVRVLVVHTIQDIHLTMQVMEFRDHQGVAQLMCGVHFSLILTKDGHVFTW